MQNKGVWEPATPRQRIHGLLATARGALTDGDPELADALIAQADDILMAAEPDSLP